MDIHYHIQHGWGNHASDNNPEASFQYPVVHDFGLILPHPR